MPDLSGVLQGHSSIPAAIWAHMEFWLCRNTMGKTRCLYSAPVFGHLIQDVRTLLSYTQGTSWVRQSLVGCGWQKRLPILLQLLSRQSSLSAGRKPRRFKDVVTLKRIPYSQSQMPTSLWHTWSCEDALTSALPEHPSLWDRASVDEAEQVAVQVPIPQVPTLAGGSGKLN